MPASGIARKDPSVLQLRAAAARTADAKQARRLLSASKDGDCHGAGWSFAAVVAAEACGMDWQTLRGWAKPAKGSSRRSQLEWLAEGIRSNADGLAGLADRPRPSRQPRLAEAQRSEAANRVEDGPDLKTDAGAGPASAAASPPNSMFAFMSAAPASCRRS